MVRVLLPDLGFGETRGLFPFFPAAVGREDVDSLVPLEHVSRLPDLRAALQTWMTRHGAASPVQGGDPHSPIRLIP